MVTQIYQVHACTFGRTQKTVGRLVRLSNKAHSLETYPRPKARAVRHVLERQAHI